MKGLPRDRVCLCHRFRRWVAEEARRERIMSPGGTRDPGIERGRRSIFFAFIAPLTLDFDGSGVYDQSKRIGPKTMFERTQLLSSRPVRFRGYKGKTGAENDDVGGWWAGSEPGIP